LSKATVTSKQVRVHLDDAGHLGLARAALAVIREQCAKGINAKGAAMVGVDGQRLDMRESGRTLDSASVFSGSVRFSTPYAAVLQKRYAPFGIAPTSYSRYIELCKLPVREGLKLVVV
jgi:hypothetical protein